MSATATNGKPLRAGGYCRTSSEKQRGNTSIPRQREAIAAFCEAQGWAPPVFYVDESRSGAKVAGRDAYQQMIRDATAGTLDVLVPFDATRFGRDGVDIMSTAKVLKGFGVFVVDAKGQMDNRDHHNALRNFVQAGVSEHERLSILERTVNGRIARARAGLTWSCNLPVGRAFTPDDEKGGAWSLSDLGVRLGAMLARYAGGEALTDLCSEYGLNKGTVLRNVRTGQLAASPYVVSFNSPEVGIKGLKVEVPAVPAVVSARLMARVQERLTHNRTWNKQHLRKYLLSGFIRCGDCNHALTAETYKGHVYYKHHSKFHGLGCTFLSVRADRVEPGVLGFVYGWFCDRPSFEAAVTLAMPAPAERESRQGELDAVGKGLDAVKKKIGNLIRRMEEGADEELLSERLTELKAERDALCKRQEALGRDLGAMPDPEATRAQAEAVRVTLSRQHSGKDWRKEGFDDVRRYLRWMFGDNPGKTGLGIYVGRNGDNWLAFVNARLPTVQSPGPGAERQSLVSFLALEDEKKASSHGVQCEEETRNIALRAEVALA